MKTRPIVPARIEFDADGQAPPRAPAFDDIYHPRIGAAAQAQHVFLRGNGLPARWAGRREFVVLETGFGLGHNFLATWAAWQADAARCERLVFLSVEAHPPRRDDLRRALRGSAWPKLAGTLVRAWPVLAPNVHALEFEQGRVRLLLAFGGVQAMLPTLDAAADAFFLDGFNPAHNPEMWAPAVLKALGRRAAEGATLATWSVARSVRDGLRTAGFQCRSAPDIGGKRAITLACFAPRAGQHTSTLPAAPADAVVVGAGLAGASVARALARRGVRVLVLDRHAQPAAETSGNPAGLFHGTVNADDGPYARLFRAAALAAARTYREAIAGAEVPGAVRGLLRLELAADGCAGMRTRLAALGLPREYVQALSARQASRCAGIALAAPAWFYPEGGWLSPAAWVRHALATSGVEFCGGVAVASIRREGDEWLLLDAEGHVLRRTPLLVLSNAAGAAGLALSAGAGPWPLHWTRGQVSTWVLPAGHAPPLRLPVAGDGYALPLPGALLCGATRTPVEAADPAPRPRLRRSDHAHNLERLFRMTGLSPPRGATLGGRAGLRLHTDDRLPIAGALPLLKMPPGQRLEQARWLPREPGLFALTALGARGITLAPLLAELVAAQATGSPWPMEQDLADAVDPARWLVRAARRPVGECQPA